MIGPISLDTKSIGKRSALNAHAAFDEAGAGNVTRVIGLRPRAKARERSTDGPKVRAPVLDPTCESLRGRFPWATRLDRIDATYASGQPPIGIYSDNLAAPNTLSMVMLSEMWDLHIDDETQVTLDVTQGHIGAVSDVNGKGMLKPSMWAGGGIWIQKELDETFTSVIRAEVIYDSSGLQTGYAGTFMETTLGVGIKPLKHFLVRPEIRYDRAFGAEPYLDGTSHQNFSLNLDMVLTLAQ